MKITFLLLILVTIIVINSSLTSSTKYGGGGGVGRSLAIDLWINYFDMMIYLISILIFSKSSF